MNILSVILVLFLLFNTAFAYNYRVETGMSYEYLSPHDVYGDWKGGYVRFYHRPSGNATYFLEFSAFSRKNPGEAFMGVFGLYKDWSPRLYTYSSISASTSSSYLPAFRLDHEFYFKLGVQKNIVPSLGFTYIKYHDIHKDYIFYPGITYYGKGFVVTYKHFLNRSQPGSVYSSTDLVSLGIGQEGKGWIYIDVSYGKQAYLATHLTSPEEVKQNALNLSVKRIMWIKKDLALSLGVSFFKLENGYEKYGFLAGFIKDF